MRPLFHALLAALLSVPAIAQDSTPKPAAKPTPRAAKPEPKEPGKNLKVFKGQGLDDEALDEAMDFMGASLGVSCAHCHVRDAKQAWTMEKDDQPAKTIARQMILMTRAINKTHFKGDTVVTCATCHNGHAKPEGTPPLMVPGAPRPTPASAEAKLKDLPELDTLLAKWTAAAGGREALEKISTRVMKGSMDMGGGRVLPLEVAQKSPGMQASQLITPRGPFHQGFDGTQGWVLRGGKASPADPQLAAQARVEADLQLPLHLKTHFPTLTVMGREAVDGKEAFAVAAKAKDESRQILYFDAATGLLVRRLSFTSTPLGRTSSETTWQDFRPVDGVLVPFKIVARGPHSASVTTFAEVRHGQPLDDVLFRMPAN